MENKVVVEFHAPAVDAAGKSHESDGSIVGRLDTIAVYRDNEICVWDENTGKPVRCQYPRENEEDVKSYLRKRVLVSGIVSFNPFGQPTSVQADSIDPCPDDSELPTIEQMSGLLKDPTGGLSLSEYLSRLRDE